MANPFEILKQALGTPPPPYTLERAPEGFDPNQDRMDQLRASMGASPVRVAQSPVSFEDINRQQNSPPVQNSPWMPQQQAVAPANPNLGQPPLDYREGITPNTQINAPAMLPPTAHQPITDPYEQYAQAMHGQANQAYEKHLQQFPQYQSPGIFNKIVAGLGGASAGYFGGAGEGLKVGQGYLNAPYQQQVSRWQQQNQPLAQAARIESSQAGHLLDPMRLFLQQQKQAETGRHNVATEEQGPLAVQNAKDAARLARQKKDLEYIDSLTLPDELKNQAKIHVAGGGTVDEALSRLRVAQTKKVEAETTGLPNLSDPESYADKKAKGFKQKTGKDATEEQKAQWMKEFKIAGAQVAAGAQGNARDFKEESSMRKEFTSLPEVKAFQIVDANMKNVSAAMEEAKRPGANFIAVDQTLINLFNKMQDQRSVVRESEYARTAKDQALLAQIKGRIDKLTSGGSGLVPEEREAMFRMIKNFHQVAKGQYDEQAAYYTDLAGRYGHDPRNVVRLGGGTPSKTQTKTDDELLKIINSGGSPEKKKQDKDAYLDQLIKGQ